MAATSEKNRLEPLAGVGWVSGGRNWGTSRIFAVDRRTREAVERLSGVKAPTLKQLLEGVPIAVAGDVYAYNVSSEITQSLQWTKRRLRLVLRHPGGFSKDLPKVFENDPTRTDEMVRVVTMDDDSMVHAKIYVLHLENDTDLVIVGSSNATKNGLRDWTEQNVAFLQDKNAPSPDDPRTLFENLWNVGVPWDKNVHRATDLLTEQPSPLFWYQQEALTAIRERLGMHLEGPPQTGREVPGGMVALPTGSGKTVVAVRWLLEDVLPDPNSRGLWIVHTTDLLDQAAATYERTAGLAAPRATVLRPHDGASLNTALRESRMIFVTRQLLARRLKTLDSMQEHPFHAIVIDEAHHVSHLGEQYPDILRKIPHRVRLGISATPFRSPEEMQSLFSYFDPSGKGQGRKLAQQTIFQRRLHEIENAEREGRRIFSQCTETMLHTEAKIDLKNARTSEEIKKHAHEFAPRKARNRPPLFC